MMLLSFVGWLSEGVVSVFVCMRGAVVVHCWLADWISLFVFCYLRTLPVRSLALSSWFFLLLFRKLPLES
jgi:hypothetical protein